MRQIVLVLILSLTAGAPSLAAGKSVPPAPVNLPQEPQAYTRYELLAPGSGKFRIIYDVTQAKTGATAFYNPIRKGSTATEEKVTDRATGLPLQFRVVSGADAKSPEFPDADAALDYIRVDLARPVPPNGGEGRIRIEKTYEDAKSYYVDGKDIVFDRSLGVKRDAVVLPANYMLVACNYPSQVEQEADGRLKVTFLNGTPAEAPLKLRARPIKALGAAPSSVKERIDERATQTRSIVYFLRAPETHAFDLYHDYTEERPGTDKYINVVRTGSKASNPSGRNLDTGETLPAEILKGDAITKAGISEPDMPPVTPESEIVVFRFNALEAGQSVRIRLSETYTDPERYKLAGDELVFDRTFGRPLNIVVLPAGWVLTNTTVPAIVSETSDGRTRLDYINPRTDEIAVLITARRAH